MLDCFTRWKRFLPTTCAGLPTAITKFVWAFGQSPADRLPRATPLLIRVLVVQRNSGEASWHELMKADVLTRSQELVEVVPDPKLDNRLLVWAYMLCLTARWPSIRAFG